MGWLAEESHVFDSAPAGRFMGRRGQSRKV